MLGVGVQPITSESAKGLGLSESRGALVNSVQAGGAAEKAGIQLGDVILAVNDRPVNTSSDLPPLIGALAPGAKVKLQINRGGKTMTEQVVLGALGAEVAGAPGPAANDDSAEAPSRGGSNSLGLVGQDLAANARQRLGLKAGEGVLVQTPGDVVLSVGRTAVGSASALNRELAGVRPGDTVMLLVRRGGATQFIAVTAQAKAG